MEIIQSKNKGKKRVRAVPGRKITQNRPGPNWSQPFGREQLIKQLVKSQISARSLMAGSTGKVDGRAEFFQNLPTSLVRWRACDAGIGTAMQEVAGQSRGAGSRCSGLINNGFQVL
ncbi:hypothetical protein [Hymenobacter saemangeumensis]|uniref:hypothetical protein n=1 Tax=Hymenobacter saemangeumensis TaxID=1084522 RepID=UPI0031E50254